MNRYYVSLCRGLMGYYVQFLAPDEETVRRHAAEYFGRMWCSVYTEAYFFEIIRRRYPSACRVVNRTKPIVLENGWEWE